MSVHKTGWHARLLFSRYPSSISNITENINLEKRNQNDVDNHSTSPHPPQKKLLVQCPSFSLGPMLSLDSSWIVIKAFPCCSITAAVKSHCWHLPQYPLWFLHILWFWFLLYIFILILLLLIVVIIILIFSC